MFSVIFVFAPAGIAIFTRVRFTNQQANDVVTEVLHICFVYDIRVGS